MKGFLVFYMEGQLLKNKRKNYDKNDLLSNFDKVKFMYKLQFNTCYTLCNLVQYIDLNL